MGNINNNAQKKTEHKCIVETTETTGYHLIRHQYHHQHWYQCYIMVSCIPLQIYPGAFHQVHNEPNGVGEKATKELLQWLLDRI